MTTPRKTLPSRPSGGLIQPARGYRYSVDALLLAAFAARFPGEFWCDLGTGCGVVAHELARRKPGSRGIAVERQPLLAACARENLKNLPVTVVRGDLRYFPWKRESLDLVVCNPPYFEPGRGRINRDRATAEARHAFYGTLTHFAAAIAPALQGRAVLCFILPFSAHDKPMHRLGVEGWFPAGRLPVRSYEGRPPDLICMAVSRIRMKTMELDCLTLYREHRVFHEMGGAFLGLKA